MVDGYRHVIAKMGAYFNESGSMEKFTRQSKMRFAVLAIGIVSINLPSAVPSSPRLEPRGTPCGVSSLQRIELVEGGFAILCRPSLDIRKAELM